jgi:hypothetical protein
MRTRSIHPNMSTDETWMNVMVESHAACVLLLALGTFSDYANRFVWDEEAIARHAGLSAIAGDIEILLRHGAIVREGERHGLIKFTYGFSRIRVSKWEAIRSLVFARDDYTCTYCGSRQPPLHCDHVVPVSRGGSDEMSNLATACKRCNLSKGDKLLEEWQA